MAALSVSSSPSSVCSAGTVQCGLMRRNASPSCSPPRKSTCTVSWRTPFSASRMRARRGLGAVLQSYRVIVIVAAFASWSNRASARRRQLVLRLRLEVAGVVALVQLARRLAPGAVDHAAALHRRALRNLVGPAQDVRVLVHLQELARSVQLPLGERAVPGPDRHVGDAVLVACQVRALGETTIEDVELALDVHRIASDGVFDLGRRVRVEVAEPAAEKRR